MRRCLKKKESSQATIEGLLCFSSTLRNTTVEEAVCVMISKRFLYQRFSHTSPSIFSLRWPARFVCDLRRGAARLFDESGQNQCADQSIGLLKFDRTAANSYSGCVRVGKWPRIAPWRAVSPAPGLLALNRRAKVWRGRGDGRGEKRRFASLRPLASSNEPRRAG